MSVSTNQMTTASLSPPDYVCTNSGQVMNQPVLSKCGHVFERSLIGVDSHCRLDKRPLVGRELIPLTELKVKIDIWKAYQIGCNELAPQPSYSIKDFIDQANNFFGRGDFGIALQHYRQALSREIKARRGNGERSIRLRKSIGKCLRELGDFSEALKMQEKILELVGGRSGETLSVAMALNDVGICEQNLGKYAAAKESHLRALAIKQMLSQKNTVHTARQIYISGSLNNLGNYFRLIGDYTEALHHFQLAFDAEKRLFGPEDINTARPLNNIGVCQMLLGRFDAALDAFDRAVKIREKKYPSKSHPELPRGWNNMGDCLRRMGKFSEALDFHEKALNMAQEMYGPIHVDVAYSLSHMGKCYYLLGDFEKAEEHLRKAYDVRSNTGQGRDIDFIYLLKDHAICLASLGRPTEAMEKTSGAALLHTHILRKNVLVYPEDHPDLASHLSNKGDCFYQLGKYHIAMDLQVRALKIREGRFGQHHPEVASSLDALGTSYYSLGEFSKALESHQRAYGIKQMVFEEDHYELADSLTGMGNSLASLGKAEEGLNAHEGALKIRKKVLGDTHPFVGACHVNIGSCLSSLERPKEAFNHYLRAYEIRLNRLGPKHPDTILSACYVSICKNLLDGKIEEVEDSVAPLTERDFNKFVAYALDYLEKADFESLQFVKNPTGFVRLHIPTPPDMEDRLENVRLNYWPLDFRLDVVEAQHTHPRYFESRILEGGYTHALFEKSEEGTPFRSHGIFKDTVEERSIIFKGPVKLRHLKDEKKAVGSIIRFPRSLIHQVIDTTPGTLTLNCVFKGSSHPVFDVFVSNDSFVDPQTERETLEQKHAQGVAEEIKQILRQFRDV